MSAYKNSAFHVQWSVLTVIPWYRQLLALVFGLGVMIVALFGIQQGSGKFAIVTIAGMAFLTLLLIFGVELNRVKIGDKVVIDFSDTGK